MHSPAIRSLDCSHVVLEVCHLSTCKRCLGISVVEGYKTSLSKVSLSLGSRCTSPTSLTFLFICLLKRSKFTRGAGSATSIALLSEAVLAEARLHSGRRANRGLYHLLISLLRVALGASDSCFGW